jgi:hypothetical protein
LASDRDSKKESGETALMPKPSDILPCTLFIKIMWEALYAFSRGKMHKKKGKQICLPLKSMSVQRQTALKTNLLLIGLF